MFGRGLDDFNPLVIQATPLQRHRCGKPSARPLDKILFWCAELGMLNKCERNETSRLSGAVFLCPNERQSHGQEPISEAQIRRQASVSQGWRKRQQEGRQGLLSGGRREAPARQSGVAEGPKRQPQRKARRRPFGALRELPAGVARRLRNARGPHHRQGAPLQARRVFETDRSRNPAEGGSWRGHRCINQRAARIHTAQAQ